MQKAAPAQDCAERPLMRSFDCYAGVVISHPKIVTVKDPPNMTDIVNPVWNSTSD
jgi:hypothetical protein